MLTGIGVVMAVGKASAGRQLGRGEDAAVLHHAPDGQVAQGHRRHGQRVVVEHAEVGALAALDRADLGIELQRVITGNLVQHRLITKKVVTYLSNLFFMK